MFQFGELTYLNAPKHMKAVFINNKKLIDKKAHWKSYFYSFPLACYIFLYIATSSTSYPELVRFVSITMKAVQGKINVMLNKPKSVSAVSFDSQPRHLLPLCFAFLICKVGTLLTLGLWELAVTNVAHIEQWVSLISTQYIFAVTIIVICSHLRESENTSHDRWSTVNRIVNIFKRDLCWEINGESLSVHG